MSRVCCNIGYILITYHEVIGSISIWRKMWIYPSCTTYFDILDTILFNVNGVQRQFNKTCNKICSSQHVYSGFSTGDTKVNNSFEKFSLHTYIVPVITLIRNKILNRSLKLKIYNPIQGYDDILKTPRYFIVPPHIT